MLCPPPPARPLCTHNVRDKVAGRRESVDGAGEAHIVDREGKLVKRDFGSDVLWLVFYPFMTSQECARVPWHTGCHEDFKPRVYERPRPMQACSLALGIPHVRAGHSEDPT